MIGKAVRAQAQRLAIDVQDRANEHFVGEGNATPSRVIDPAPHRTARDEIA